MKKLLIPFILVLILLGVGGIYYYFFSVDQTTVREAKQEGLLPTSTPTLEIFPSPTVTPSAVSDEELIKAALAKKHNWQPEDIVVAVKQNDGTYASGSVTEAASQTGGGLFFAAKVGGEWQIVADGNGVITCVEVAPYPHFPTSLIPECYDTTAGKIVKR